jgi:hypothetical protein
MGQYLLDADDPSPAPEYNMVMVVLALIPRSMPAGPQGAPLVAQRWHVPGGCPGVVGTSSAQARMMRAGS